MHGHNANCYTSSNAACNVSVKKTDPKLLAIRFHGVRMEYAGFADGPPRSLPDNEATAAPSASAAAPSTSAAVPSDLHAAIIALAADPSMSAAVPSNPLAEVLAFAENLLKAANTLTSVRSTYALCGRSSWLWSTTTPCAL